MIIITMITKMINLRSRVAIQAVQWWALWVISLSPPPSLGWAALQLYLVIFVTMMITIMRFSYCGDDDESCQSGILYQHICRLFPKLIMKKCTAFFTLGPREFTPQTKVAQVFAHLSFVLECEFNLPQRSTLPDFWIPEYRFPTKLTNIE